MSPLFLSISVFPLDTHSKFIFHLLRVVVFFNLVSESLNLNWLLCSLLKKTTPTTTKKQLHLCVYYLRIHHFVQTLVCFTPYKLTHSVFCSLIKDSVAVQQQSEGCQMLIYLFFETTSHYSAGVVRKLKVYCFSMAFGDTWLYKVLLHYSFWCRNEMESWWRDFASIKRGAVPRGMSMNILRYF